MGQKHSSNNSEASLTTHNTKKKPVSFCSTHHNAIATVRDPVVNMFSSSGGGKKAPPQVRRPRPFQALSADLVRTDAGDGASRCVNNIQPNFW